MRKLIILPGSTDSLGGTIVTLKLLVKGIKSLGATEQLVVLAKTDSMIHRYLIDAGEKYCLQLIPAQDRTEFLKLALKWVSEQPKDYPLLLDNCIDRQLMPAIVPAIPGLRLSQRPVYHFCHDLALSDNFLGYLVRKLVFTALNPKAICNSKFTASYIRKLMPNIKGILYQPVDTAKFNDAPPLSLPAGLEPIVQSGARVMLTPSRLNQPGIVNDKNLRALIPVVAQLKAMGHFYHAVIIGDDKSPGKVNTQALWESAEQLGVADRFTILPPVFTIEEYYKYANVLVTLAPREPFGRTVVEAIACGVPVVGSNTGGIGEILNNFAPEWTVDPEDPVAVAETIIKVAADANTPNLLTQGKNWVKTHCSVEGYARNILEITGLAPAEQNLIMPQLKLSTKA